MIIQYENRIGQAYYLRQGITKTGRIQYFFSTKQNGKGEAVAQIPEGYEIYEHPENAQVFLRKKLPQLINNNEKALIQKHLDLIKRSRRYRVDYKKEFITIYESNTDFDRMKSTCRDLFLHAPRRPGVSFDDAINAAIRTTDQYYTAVLRFCLVDKVQRKFDAERFCFQGSIDDWIYLSGPEDLKEMAEKYIALLGTDNFLIYLIFKSRYYCGPDKLSSTLLWQEFFQYAKQRLRTRSKLGRKHRGSPKR